MQNLTHVTQTFPSVTLPSHSGGLPVEVSLIAQLGHGAGNHLYTSVAARQQSHEAFINELDEPSTKLASPNFQKDDPSALYSFIVGPKGHPFHCHAGNRIFMAVSGSGGAQLRFSTASEAQIKQDPKQFLNALRFVNIPPDCMFTVRFGGETWHQFYPLAPHCNHPVFFALSCHTNELGGNLSDNVKAQVLSDDTSIPALTQLLPPEMVTLLESHTLDFVPTTTLALDAPAGTFHRLVCNTVRGSAGKIRGKWAGTVNASGFLTHSGFHYAITTFSTPPETMLLHRHLPEKIHYQDTFRLELKAPRLADKTAAEILALLLEGFLVNAPKGVSRLMSLRNALVKPLGLRTSTLGCPVSSLLSQDKSNLFANRYPVLDQSVDPTGTEAQVVLGADDKHLKFRACVTVKKQADGSLEICLGNKVQCHNTFGRFYMAVINQVHHHYIAKAILRRAVAHLMTQGLAR